MYERFTDRARKALQLANQEAMRVCQSHIEPRDILIGILKEGRGVAAAVLKDFCIGLREVRLYFCPVPITDEQVILGRLPHDEGTKLAIAMAIQEAKDLNHNYVGTEHLLLGLFHTPSTRDFLKAKLLTREAIVGKLATMIVGKPRNPTEEPIATVPSFEPDIKLVAPVPRDANFVASLQSLRARLVESLAQVDELLAQSPNAS